jgi:hypothetical protein
MEKAVAGMALSHVIAIDFVDIPSALDEKLESLDNAQFCPTVPHYSFGEIHIVPIRDYRIFGDPVSHVFFFWRV